MFTGTKPKAAVDAAVKELRTSPAIDNGVQASVAAGVGQLLGDGGLWSAVGDVLADWSPT